MPGPFRSKALRSLVLPVQVPRLNSEVTSLLEQEINGRLQMLKLQIGQVSSHDDKRVIEALLVQRAELVLWHQLLLNQQQTLRRRRHIEFCERFQQAAKEKLSPDEYGRLITAATEQNRYQPTQKQQLLRLQ